MSEWNKWFRGFMKGWFSALIAGILTLEEDKRTQILNELTKVEAPSDVLLDFVEAWKSLDNPSNAKEMISASLDSINEIDSDVGGFFQNWCGTLMDAIASEREDVKETILGACGQTCNEAFAQTIFKEAWEEADSLESFIALLNSKMGGEHNPYELVDENTVIAKYEQCYCPIVGFNFISSPAICNCSSSWLKAGFESALDHEVSVKREESVMAGGNQCRFKINLSG